MTFNRRSTQALVLALTLFLPVHVAADTDGGLIGDGAQDLPIFDAHMHYKEPAWDRYSVSDIIDLMDRNSVAMGFVSSSPDEGTIMMLAYAPSRVVPALRPYHGEAGSSNWTRFPGMAEYLKGRLERYPHQGIGEFHIRSIDPSDAPLLREVIKMAKARDILLHVHSDAAAVRWLYQMDPEVRILWAHAGLSESPETVDALMSEYPTLLADTALRDFFILGRQGALNPEWEAIIMRYQDRLMLGSDTWVTSRWDEYSTTIATMREWLAKLPRDVAEKIAFRNAERIFGHSITQELIGTR